MRIDLHVHSKHSRRPSQWILKKIGCPESFTEPLQIYDIAKCRGMTHVTITDHNSIDGALEIAHLPDTFVSEEVTSYFPEDGCKLHILAVDINEAQHAEIQKLRQNVFDLNAYLRQENIFNIAAHPLYAVNDRLTVDHLERLLLLFQNFELNGARNGRENQTMAHNLYGIAWQFFRRKFNLGRYATKDSLVRFLDNSLGPEPAPEPGMLSRVYCFLSARKRKRVTHPLSDSLAALLPHETQTLIDENPDLVAAAGGDGKRIRLSMQEAGQTPGFSFLRCDDGLMV